MEIDFHSIVIFLHRKGLKPTDIQKEIDSVFGLDSFSYSSITRTIRDLSFSPSKKSIAEKHQNLLHEQNKEAVQKALIDFPFYSLKQISMHTLIPKATVFRILTRDLGYEKKNLKWISHCLNCSQKVSRVEISKRLLKVLQKAK